MSIRAFTNRAAMRRRLVARWLLRAQMDLRDLLAGRRDPMVPPRLMGMPSQLPGVGAVVVDRILLDAADLQKDGRVLDIGCGVGRMAVPLTRHLDSGSYEGFDIMPRTVGWAQRRITKRHPNFRFQLADIHNALYNPKGTQTASEYRFPFEDGEFDLAFATSVFTHLIPLETIHYFEEAARVLKPGGRLASSFMLLNEESERLIADGLPDRPSVVTESNLMLDHELSDPEGHRYRTPHPHLPEHYVALYEEDVVGWLEQAGFSVDQTIYGSWCGRLRQPKTTGQDFIVAVKN